MKIKINNLRVKTIIGVYPHEKNIEQELVINAKLSTACYDGKSDNIADTIDYNALCKMITSEVQTSRFELIEKLAHHLAAKIKQDKRITKLKLEITKPACVENAESISVVVELN